MELVYVADLIPVVRDVDVIVSELAVALAAELTLVDSGMDLVLGHVLVLVVQIIVEPDLVY